MSKVNPAPEVKQIADELIPLYHQHLLENRVRLAYRFSDKEPQSHGRQKYGVAKKVTEEVASLAHGDGDTDHQYDLLKFVCIKCLGWKVEGEMAFTEINGEDHDFCEVCRDELDNAKVQEPDDAFMAWIAKREEKAEIIRDGGPSTSPGIWLLIFYKPVWDRAGDDIHRAMVDELLCSCGSSLNQSGEVRLTKIPAEVVTYHAILFRHGTEWNSLLSQAARIIKGEPQLSMSYADDTPAIGDEVQDKAA